MQKKQVTTDEVESFLEHNEDLTYPDLKSSSNFQDLAIELEGTENRITIARQDYNDAVTEYNSKRRRFPSNIIASIFNFEQKPLYKASEGAQTAPSVDFSS